MTKRHFSVVVPDNPDLLIALATKILEKHQQDGSASIISALFAELLATQLQIARTENDRRNELDRLKEKYNEERNLILGLHHSQNSFTPGTVRYFITSVRDILLGQYRSNERQLGDWGFTVNSPKGAVQVIIPKKADQLIELAKRVLQKHEQDGAGSPLHQLNWNDLKNKLAEAATKLDEGRKCNRDKENATQKRNLALGIAKSQDSKTAGTVKYLVKSIRDTLLGVFRGREQELGNWGFEVNGRTATNGAAPPHTDPMTPP